MGYALAGFDVTGVDLEQRDAYPFTFHRSDALTYLAANPDGWDAIHASPPCQAHTTMSNRWRGKGGKADEHVDLIPAVREALRATGVPYVIENVPGARAQLVNPVTLSGGMFGLGVDRPRLFESNVLIMPPPKQRAVNPVGVYGEKADGRRLWTRADGTHQRAAASLEEAREAMGMPWASWRGCAEAIPPSYTEHIGRQLLEHLAVTS